MLGSSACRRARSMTPDDAWLIALQLRACPDHDLYFEGRRTRPENYVAGVTSIYDLRRQPVADIRDPFHCLMAYLPGTALDAVARETGARRAADLRHRPGVSVDDPVVRHLLSALLPAMAKPGEAHQLFIDHVSLALTVHMASVYGGMSPSASIPRGGLAPWKERRATELLTSSLGEEITLGSLADECGFADQSHFTRVFTKMAGVSPGHWRRQNKT